MNNAEIETIQEWIEGENISCYEEIRPQNPTPEYVALWPQRSRPVYETESGSPSGILETIRIICAATDTKSLRNLVGKIRNICEGHRLNQRGTSPLREKDTTPELPDGASGNRKYITALEFTWRTPYK